jgi:hypothetical protein
MRNLDIADMQEKLARCALVGLLVSGGLGVAGADPSDPAR